jgi:hypothetical protein
MKARPEPLGIYQDRRGQLAIFRAESDAGPRGHFAVT